MLLIAHVHSGDAVFDFTIATKQKMTPPQDEFHLQSVARCAHEASRRAIRQALVCTVVVTDMCGLKQLGEAEGAQATGVVVAKPLPVSRCYD